MTYIGRTRHRKLTMWHHNQCCILRQLNSVLGSILITWNRHILSKSCMVFNWVYSLKKRTAGRTQITRTHNPSIAYDGRRHHNKMRVHTIGNSSKWMFRKFRTITKLLLFTVPTISGRLRLCLSVFLKPLLHAT